MMERIITPATALHQAQLTVPSCWAPSESLVDLCPCSTPWLGWRGNVFSGSLSFPVSQWPKFISWEVISHAFLVQLMFPAAGNSSESKSVSDEWRHTSVEAA